MTSSAETARLESLSALDRRLVDVAQGIKILSYLTCPAAVQERFLSDWQRGKPSLPTMDHQIPDLSATLTALDAIASETDRAHPVGGYIFRTADSYRLAARMLQSVGTPEFTELSIALYGSPTDPISPNHASSLTAADYFIEATRDIVQSYQLRETDYCLSAEAVAERLRAVLVPFFEENPLEIFSDPTLTSKAAASATRIRLRGETRFSELDVPQLLHHEGFVHTLTAINGRQQPNLPSLSLGSPRTTATQEGIATLAELITASIDLSRLERIALRIRGVQMALEGADFIEVFKYFLAAGQPERESLQSTVRVFRGGDPRGRIAFTKDTVYLRGLLHVHTFLRKAIQANKFAYAERLFAGRLALSDVIPLEPYFDSGFIVPPRYEPPWLVNRQCLAGTLCYSVFINSIDLGSISLENITL